MKAFRLFFCLMLWLLLAACGTDTGNPGIRTPLNNDAGSIVPFAESFVESLCVPLTTCHDSLNFKRCELGLYSHEPMIEALNLNITSFLNLTDVYEAEVQGKVIPKVETREPCLNDIRSLSCDDTLVQDAFNEGLDNPFAQSHKMVPRSCVNPFESREGIL